MIWDRLKRWFAPGRGAGPAGARESSWTPPGDDGQLRWLGPDENPWGVPVLDVRPVTVGMLSMSKDPQCARNAMSFGGDDGLGFVGIEPESTRRVPARLRFRIDGTLADGALFLPTEMEHKWALYLHRGRILCVRSWTRRVDIVADTRVVGDHLEVTEARGAYSSDDEPPDFLPRVLDFLLRTHALDQIHPAPLPPGIEGDPQRAAVWCMSCFGNRAHFATPHRFAAEAPGRPLRTDSLLHIAVARGDAARAGELLDAGVPAGLLARDGLAPLHWALARDDDSMIHLLLGRGSPVDVRSDEGATPLMQSIQARKPGVVALLLDHGADPNAADARGFTALHRAAEMGLEEIVRLLLDRGADSHPEAQGHTPRSLAEARGEAAVAELLGRR